MTRARSLLNKSLRFALCLGFFAAPTAVLLGSSTAVAAPAGARGTIQGVVTDAKTRQKLKDALVILQCSCLQGTRETRTNSSGLYSFSDLPPGTYTVQVLFGKADVSKVTTLPRGAKFRANFSLDPKNEFRRTIIVDSKPVRADTAVATKVDMEQAKSIPVGSGTGRDFTDVVQMTPTASTDSAGISLAGTTGAESKYSVDGANVNNPSFGTVGASIVQEFISEVEVQESGYDAEFGGASGGVVSARRISGTNKVRGEAVIRYTPRLAEPRFIQATDEALRVTLTGDHQLQGVIVASGPIIKDRLFWSVGVAPQATWSSLIQKFFHRVDRDESGGFEECPYENGKDENPDNDCVPGGNYIATQEFDSQKFSKFDQTGVLTLGYQATIGWAINPKHRINVFVGGGPSFQNTTYRLPFTSSPNAFGTNPSSDPLGGGSRIATGIVNDHFGTTKGNFTSTGINYLGRVADDKLEIDAGFSFTHFASEEAWKLKNPSLKKIPATQEQDSQGANLYEFLDKDEALGFVPDVEDKCNSVDLPGLACPVRRWLSGGLGEYNEQQQIRAEGRVHLTNFFNAAGAHQVKYGTQIEHVQRRLRSQYSGENSSDFYNQCDASAGEEGSGGEWCYVPGDDAYVTKFSQRVNNHRFILVDTDNPDLRFPFGYGAVRKEQKDLRAIATGLGAGVRADAYDETLSTQNYGVFLQDKWAVLSNLYLSAGVRWELQDMRNIFGDRAMFIWDNVGPRVGVVYDWTDEGKSRLFASYGWFFQPIPLQLNSRVFGGLITVQRSFRASDCVGKSVTIDGVDHPKWQNGQPTEYCVDFPQSTSGLTVGSIVPRLRGQYNEQFQLGYEQEVIEDLVLGVQWLHTNLGRAVEDVSTNGGLNFMIANPGVPVDKSDIDAKRAQCDELQADLDALDLDAAGRGDVARALQQCLFLADAYERVNTLFDSPTRNFDAWTFRIQKRFAQNWILLASYTYSRLVGNYDGFVDPITGSINIGVASQYDIPELVRNSFGPLSFDQPHRVKLDGFYSFDLREAGRLTLGTSFRFNSGYPVSLRAYNNRYGSPVIYVVPRGAGGRVEPNYQWNLSAGYAYPLPGDLEIEFSARILNVTNAKAVLRVDEVYSFQNTRPVAGGDLADLKHTKIQNSGNPTEFFQRTIVAPQGNYGVETQFQAPLAGQFELKLRF